MRKIIIIGGGPIGMNIAIKFQERNLDFLLIEANDHLGGQLIELYPKKEIVDIPGINTITAENYISLLEKQINLSSVKFNEKVVDMSQIDGGYQITTDKGTKFSSEYVVIATGLGFYSPRKMGLENEDSFKNILYSLKDYTFLKNKKVAIFGGGDSALDWAKHISSISNDVSLIHRRNEFRGNADTIRDCANLKVYLSYVPNKLIIENNILKGIQIKSVIDEKTIELDAEYILVNYGNLPSPLTIDVPKEGAFVKVDNENKVGNKIFAIGDICTYEGKIKRIAPGLKEIDKILKQII